MPIREAPPDVNDSQGTPEPSPVQETHASGGNGYHSPPSGSSRWVDYDTHELLQTISELEDERRWARFREGIAWAILFHILLLSAVTWIPKYVFKVPPVTDPFDAIKERKDLTYLDLPPDALRQTHPKIAPKPLREKPQIDKQTLEELNKESPPTPAPAPPPPAQQANVEPRPQPVPPIPPSQQSQSPVEAPRPSAVPARPNFAMGSQNPEDQLRDAERNAMRNQGAQNYNAPSGAMTMHPGAAAGGVQVLSDTQGVDFSSWLARWHYVTEQTWDPLIPDEVNPPILKSGEVAIRFKVLPNGRLMDGSVFLEGRSGDVALDRAAWGALVGSSYPPLPREFHGPYIELRAYFLYNMQPQ
jgi:outer membrane biosynthesis protein TonB